VFSRIVDGSTVARERTEREALPRLEPRRKRTAMNYEHAQQWMAMISEDLREAKRRLRARSAAAAYLRARIAEDEAILGRLDAGQLARRANER
jgi:hypothetical protein